MGSLYCLYHKQESDSENHWGQNSKPLGTNGTTNPDDYILTKSREINTLLAESPEEIIKMKCQIEDLKVLLMEACISI